MELKPGSNKAVEQGCKCPRMDNCYGKGYLGTDNFVISENCKLHWHELQIQRGSDTHGAERVH